MKRLAILSVVLTSGLAAGCASSSSAAGSGIVFADCYSYHCVGYDDQWRAHLYLRTPSTPAFPARGEVRLTANRRAAPRTVDRPSVRAGSLGSTVSRATPASPAPSRPTTTAARP